MPLRTIAVLLQEPVALFEYGVLAEVFGVDRTEDGVPGFDYRVCAERPGVPMQATGGTHVIASHDLAAAADADLVAVPASPEAEHPSAAVVEVLRAAADRGAHVLSVCSGAFTLAAAGLLDGRDCTTHWRYTDKLAEMVPTARVNPNVLYCQDGTLITSAGTAAGIDACLHLVRSELGSQVANHIARRMVVPPHRDGGQQQYIDRPVPTADAESLGPVLTWLLDHLDEPHSVASLAQRAAMSERTFARRFAAETGTTPHQWLTDQRVLRAKELLEGTALSVDQVAERTGFGTPALLRHHFTRCTGITPTAFRRQHRVSA
jgi:transcriptional regulator GlxA family with amidase domain